MNAADIVRHVPLLSSNIFLFFLFFGKPQVGVLCCCMILRATPACMARQQDSAPMSCCGVLLCSNAELSGEIFRKLDPHSTASCFVRDESLQPKVFSPIKVDQSLCGLWDSRWSQRVGCEWRVRVGPSRHIAMWISSAAARTRMLGLVVALLSACIASGEDSCILERTHSSVRLCAGGCSASPETGT